MEKIIIIGCGGHAKSVLDTIEARGEYEIAGFVGKDESEVFSYRGYGIVGTDADLQRLYMSGIRYACIGIGYLGGEDIRERLYERLKETGFILPPIIDTTSIVARDVLIGEGSFIGKHTVINADAVIGKMAIVNTGAIIEHDCIVGDFSHVAVAAVLCGGTEIGNSCLIGANAAIRQGIRIGKNVIVAAGAVVVREVPDKAIVMGIPANIMNG